MRYLIAFALACALATPALAMSGMHGSVAPPGYGGPPDCYYPGEEQWDSEKWVENFASALLNMPLDELKANACFQYDVKTHPKEFEVGTAIAQANRN